MSPEFHVSFVFEVTSLHFHEYDFNNHTKRTTKVQQLSLVTTSVGGVCSGSPPYLDVLLEE